MTQQEAQPTPESQSATESTYELGVLDYSDDQRALRKAGIVAFVAHLVLLAITFPNLSKPLPVAARAQQVYKVQQIKLKPPAPAQEQAIPERKTKRIPIPDPTPDDPEPIELAELPELEIDLPPIPDAVFGIPDAPPGVADGPEGVFQIGEGINPPRKISGEQPRYSEDARKARIQGVVVLQAVIDVLGNVTHVKVLKGLNMGLTETAIEAVKGWKYEPAKREGVPVPVYLSLLVNFSLQ